MGVRLHVIELNKASKSMGGDCKPVVRPAHSCTRTSSAPRDGAARGACGGQCRVSGGLNLGGGGLPIKCGVLPSAQITSSFHGCES